jgi:hypothetical protein
MSVGNHHSDLLQTLVACLIGELWDQEFSTIVLVSHQFRPSRMP